MSDVTVKMKLSPTAAGKLFQKACRLEDDNRALRAQLEQAEARAAELESALTTTRDNMIDWAMYAEQYFRDKHDLAGDIELANKALRSNHLGPRTEIPFILRKQAEAVEEAVVHALRAVGSVDPFEVDIHRFANDCAQRLRQRADELEAGKAGGEQ